MCMEKWGWGVLQIMGVLFLFALFFMSKSSPAIACDQGGESRLKTYIVHLKEPEGGVFAESENLEGWYKSFLPARIASSKQQERMVYSYRNVLTGFAARLTEEEAKEMEAKEGFVSARPEKIYHLHTTHSPSFMGLHKRSGLWKGSNLGKGVIIGVMDSGILPSHPSFGDEGMPPPPAKWTGLCEFNKSGGCSNKVIGARNFESGSKGMPPFDEGGHGSHTASIAAGNFVKHANVLGNAKGTAAGVAPGAHLAIYKICTDEGCAGADILAAFDAAIADGVDVLSVSVGQKSTPFYDDAIAVGAFAAIRKGILVSCSAGNYGPTSASVGNAAPWILTVGASTIDRSIRASVKLGNGEKFDGESLFQPSDFPPELFPLVYSPYFCSAGTVNVADVEGKVVLCDSDGKTSITDKGRVVKQAGGVAMIVANSDLAGSTTIALEHVLPASHVSYSAGLSIKAYISSTSHPTASIAFEGTIIGEPSAPEVIFFSARGPSLATPGILKPDIIGPGMNILAAWPTPLHNNSPSKLTFNLLSGTSMSCPHLSGVAALIKSSHPDWSPAAIKSAIMTTADILNLKDSPILDQTEHPASIFAIGAGHVNPLRANDPGLIYDIQPDDYIPYLCGLGYNDTQVGLITLRTVRCSEESSIPEAQLNYPSFSIALRSKARRFQRTVTNVGKPTSSYTVHIAAPPGVDVTVKPHKLHFTKRNQKKTYTVTFKRSSSGVITGEQYAQGFLKWVSATHSARSPIAVKFE